MDVFEHGKMCLSFRQFYDHYQTYYVHVSKGNLQFSSFVVGRQATNVGIPRVLLTISIY